MRSCSSASAQSRSCSTATSRKNQLITQATAEYQRLSTESQAAQARLKDLESQEASLKNQIAAAATPEEKARLEQLTRDIEAAKGQAKGSQDELSKLKRDRELSDSDRGRLLKQVETLQAQLTLTGAERDRLQAAQKASPPAAGQDDRALLQKQLQDERNRSAEATAEITKLKQELSAARNAATTTSPGGSSATAQDVTRAFTDGVRAYDLGNFKASAQYMQDAIRMQSGVKQLAEGSANGRHSVRPVRAAVLSRRGPFRHEERLR